MFYNIIDNTILGGESLRIRDLREDKDLTQAEIAKILNCNRNTYTQYETGKRQVPLQVLVKLSRFYDTSVDYLIEETDEIKPYPKKNTEIK